MKTGVLAPPIRSPSIAYGHKHTQKHKIAPQEKLVQPSCSLPQSISSAARNNRYIGYDARRNGMNIPASNEADKNIITATLIEEWGWNRDDCI